MHESDIVRWTHREFRTRLAWLNEQWNRPSRTDHYLMQIAQKVEDVLRMKPITRKADHFKIPFVKVAPPKPLSKAEAAKRSKMRWFAAVGYKPESS